MSILYVLAGIATALALSAALIAFSMRHQLEFATASLRARALGHRVLLRTACAFIASVGYFIILELGSRPLAGEYDSILSMLLYSGTAALYFIIVPLPPYRLIASFGVTGARIAWSCYFGFITPTLISFMLMPFYGSGVFL